MRRAIKTLDNFAHRLIADRENVVKLEGEGNDLDSEMDLLSLYMAHRDERGQPLSPKALR